MTIKRYEVDGKLMNLDEKAAKRLGLNPDDGQERVRKFTDYPVAETPVPAEDHDGGENVEEPIVVTPENEPTPPEDEPTPAETPVPAEGKAADAPNKARRTRQH